MGSGTRRISISSRELGAFEGCCNEFARGWDVTRGADDETCARGLLGYRLDDRECVLRGWVILSRVGVVVYKGACRWGSKLGGGMSRHV